jgi:hypothetical protein
MPNQRAVAKKFKAEYVEVPCCHALILDKNYMAVVEKIDSWIRRKFVCSLIGSLQSVS